MSQFGLLASARFLPLFLTQGFGALNDNFFRTSLVVLVTYRLADQSPLPPAQIAALATALVVLPYFLFSALAGQLSDRFEKSFIIRCCKMAEIGVAGLAAAGLLLGDVSFLLAVLFLLGTQSAFFSPVKFAILPQHLQERQLIGGNALLELGTFIAVLAGSILGAVLINLQNGSGIVAVMVILIALAGYVAARRIPHANASAPAMRLNWNLVFETGRLLRLTNQNNKVFWGIIGISWFWMIGSLYVTQLAPFTKTAIGANEMVVTWLLAIFTVGIGIGALMCNRLLRSVISPRFVFLSAAGISVFGADLWLATLGGPAAGETLLSLAGFLSELQGLRITADIFLLAVFAGIYSVPLYALVQSQSGAEVRARTIAAGNIVLSLFSVGGSMATLTLLGKGLSVPEVYALGALANIVGAFFIHRELSKAR